MPDRTGLNQEFLDGLASLTQNEYLVLAGTLHGIHAITSRLSPVGASSGAQVIEGESFKMTIFLTPTGPPHYELTIHHPELKSPAQEPNSS